MTTQESKQSATMRTLTSRMPGAASPAFGSAIPHIGAAIPSADRTQTVSGRGPLGSDVLAGDAFTPEGVH